ncbi:helix-turn-helix domain-containing protein [Rhodopila sp.]|jgi:CRP/FNR family nitrogen fixation transcriptional regulator|uniref:helix-turn-helix domain-containing protein n=1 Tax=Rhodopila sp. TaxID=2480087 RepID=UPI002B76807F|nr:helix-turn-helix domain-containing protein [Rhodopila sp.]HVZ08196.1 helix-turn-helix domain-containing protein [Rhodopila sp.]
MSITLTHHGDNRFTAVQAGLAQTGIAQTGIAQAGVSPTGWAMDAFPDQGVAGGTIHFVADQEIYAEGDAANTFFKVVRGVVRTCKFLSDGRRQIDAFYGEGEIFGFEAGAEHRLSAEAVSDCVLIPYRRRGFEMLAGRDERVAGQMFSYVMRCLERSQDHSLLLGRRSAAQKLAAFLLEMAARAPGGAFIDLAMTRQDIADYLGLTIETVSRTLSQFEREGVIRLAGARRVTLTDMDELRALNS